MRLGALSNPGIGSGQPTSLVQDFPARALTVGASWWSRFNTATPTNELGLNPPIAVNSGDLHFHVGSLISDGSGDNSVGFGGSFPDPGCFTINSPFQSAQFWAAFRIQADALMSSMALLTVGDGSNVNGEAILKIVSDGGSGLIPRFETVGPTNFATKQASGSAVIPIGRSTHVVFQRTANDVVVYVNGIVVPLALVGGTFPQTWGATPNLPWCIGAFQRVSGGYNGLLGDVLFGTGVISEANVAALQSIARQVVKAYDVILPDMTEDDPLATVSVAKQVHPEGGTVLSIVDVATYGTAGTSGLALTYNPNPISTEAADDQFTWRAANNSVTSDASARVHITQISSPAPTLQEDLPLPAPTGTRSASPSNFASQYNALQPGEHLILDNGNYGSITLNRAGTVSNKLVIRALNRIGPKLTALTISGANQIVSGLDVNAGSNVVTGVTLRIDASNVRFTRGAIRNGLHSMRQGAGVLNTIIDHCEIHRWRGRMNLSVSPRDQKNLIIARCWIHEALGGAAAPYDDINTCLSYQETTNDREKRHDSTVRFNYFGPGVAPTGTKDYMHIKASHILVAFNKWDVPSGHLLSQRNGLDCRFVGNYSTGGKLRLWDDGHWAFGNLYQLIECPAGKSGYYDTTKSLFEGNTAGTQPGTTRARFAGNNTDMLLGAAFGNTLCTTGPAPCPDPIPCGGFEGVGKPAYTWEGVTYAAIPVGVGISIRAHIGTVTQENSLPCIDQVQNLSFQAGTAAPANWKADLFLEYPWIEAICSDPTSQTGALGNQHPSSLAEALIRGDLANPSVGYLRAGNAGMPA